MHVIFMVYLLLCAGLFVFVSGWFVYEDVYIGPDPQFGYNYNSRWSYFYVAVVSTPFVNLVLFSFIGALLLMRKFK